VVVPGRSHATAVLAGDSERLPVDLDADDALGTAERRTEGEHPRAAPEVDDRSVLDVAVEVGDVHDVGGQFGRRRILFEADLRVLEAGDDGQLGLQRGFRRHQRPSLDGAGRTVPDMVVDIFQLYKKLA